MVNESENQPQPCEISLQVCDSLVLEALKAPSKAAIDCFKVQRDIEAGNIDGAIAILRELCPALIQDGRYLFKLTKQKFVELCRQGADEAAIACARDTLAPLALDAYPEAYLEFKQTLKVLVYTKELQRQQHQDASSRSCAQESAEELAATVFHAAWHILGLQEPTLFLLLKYLLQLHMVHRSAMPSGQLPEQELVEQLLLPGRDAPPLPCEGGPSSFREADLQALIQCAGSSRRDAMEAIKHARGDIQLAFRNELSRRRIDGRLLGKLLAEYIAFRGLEDQVEVPADSMDMCVAEQGGASAGHGDDMQCRAAEGADAPAGGREIPSSSAAGIQQCAGADWRCSGLLAQQRGASSSDEALVPWSVRQNLQALHPDRSMSQSPPSKVPRCQDMNGHQTSRLAPNSNLQERLVQISQMAKDGQVDDIVRLAQEVDAGFFDERPELLFDLRRCRFLQLLGSGDTTKALLYARSNLSPLAANHEQLQPMLKATTALLLGGFSDQLVGPALQAATANLQAALRAHMGIQPPRLVRLMQVLLGVQRAWLRREKFSDPFQAGLKVEALRQQPQQAAVMARAGSAAGAAAAGTAAAAAAAGGGPLQVQVPALLSESEYGSGAEDNDDMDEEGILRLMEILEVPRSTSIDLLLHHDGDVGAAIMSALAG